MTKRNLQDIDFQSIERELNQEDNQQREATARLNIYNQPNQQDIHFLEKERREENLHVGKGMSYFVVMTSKGKRGSNGG